jgi:hypothetical protein
MCKKRRVNNCSCVVTSFWTFWLLFSIKDLLGIAKIDKRLTDCCQRHEQNGVSSVSKGKKYD